MVATEIEQEQGVVGEQGTSENGKAKRPAGVYVSTPDELRQRLENEAKAAGKTPAVYVRDLLAAQWGLTLPPPRTRKKYASDDERKAAQKAQIKTRADAIRMLKEKYAAELQALMEQAKQQQNAESEQNASGEGEEGQATA